MLVLVGCNHRSAPLAFREQLAFRAEEIPAALGRARGCEGVDEVLILSTCNRVEVLARGTGSSDAGVLEVKRFLCAERSLSPEEVERHSYHFTDLDAVRHLFRVAAGLDSMILGEPQILGQVKRAYLAAKDCAVTGTVLERLMQQCLGAAKRIRTETGISRNAVSVAYTAVDLARRIFGDLEGRRALLIGAGKMTQLVAKHFVKSGVSDFAVTSRTFNRAESLAERCGGRAVHWQEGLARLSEVDIVVSCTAAPQAVLSREHVAEARRRRRGAPLFIIDIAVPRDVDPAVNELDGVYLYDIDGLQSVVDSNLKERERAADQAKHMIEREIKTFDRWRQSLEITPTIVSLRERFLELARHEVERFEGRLSPLSADQHRAVEELARGVVHKILHRPVLHLRESATRGDVDASTSLYRRIFGLEQEEGPDAEPAVPDRPENRGPRRVIEGGKER